MTTNAPRSTTKPIINNEIPTDAATYYTEQAKLAAWPHVVRALRELYEQVDSLEDYWLTRDLPNHEAEDIFHHALYTARIALKKADALGGDK